MAAPKINLDTSVSPTTPDLSALTIITKIPLVGCKLYERLTEET
jgi:hypothetical protein